MLCLYQYRACTNTVPVAMLCLYGACRNVLESVSFLPPKRQGLDDHESQEGDCPDTRGDPGGNSVRDPGACDAQLPEQAHLSADKHRQTTYTAGGCCWMFCGRDVPCTFAFRPKPRVRSIRLRNIRGMDIF